VIFGATTEVLFVTLAAVCDHRYRNGSFVTRWFEESCRIAVAMHREINLELQVCATHKQNCSNH
jgi:hypothetical protein